MKRVIGGGLVLCALALSASAKAERKFGMAGCGLGSIVMGSKGGQVSAATTNGTGAQSFGITSGTSNCVAPAAEKAQIEQENFISNNYASLSREAAQGSGETVAAFAGTMGCDRAVFSEFGATLQTNYTKIFAAPGAIAALDSAKEEIVRNPKLMAACTKLGVI